MSASQSNRADSQTHLSSDDGVAAGAVLAVLLCQQVLGAFTFPIAKFGLASIEPFTFAFFRFVLSSLVLLTIVRSRKHRVPISKADRWKIVGLGFLIIPFNQAMYLLGQSMTAAGHGALLFATSPVWILLAAMVYLHEKLAWRRGVGIVIALIGVGIIMTAGAVEIGTEYLLGDLIILIAVLVWAHFTVFGKPLVRRYGAFRVTAYALASGSAMYFPFGLYRAMEFDYAATPWSAWLSVVYMGIGTSVIAYVLWYWVVKHMALSRIALFHNIEPVIATFVAWIWLGEPLGWSFVAGGVVVLIGVAISEVHANRRNGYIQKKAAG